MIQERDGGNTPTVSHSRGADLSGSLEGAGGIGGLLGRSSGYSSLSGNWSTHYFYHADGNGNITYLVNSSQGLAADYRYDPFGNTISSGGALATANVYRFSSKEVHANSGMYCYLYRFYDPNLQRWISRDPGGDVRRHPGSYVALANSPPNTIDALGLMQAPATESFTVTLTALYGQARLPWFSEIFLLNSTFYHSAPEPCGPTSVIVRHISVNLSIEEAFRAANSSEASHYQVGVDANGNPVYENLQAHEDAHATVYTSWAWRMFLGLQLLYNRCVSVTCENVWETYLDALDRYLTAWAIFEMNLIDSTDPGQSGAAARSLLPEEKATMDEAQRIMAGAAQNYNAACVNPSPK